MSLKNKAEAWKEHLKNCSHKHLLNIGHTELVHKAGFLCGWDAKASDVLAAVKKLKESIAYMVSIEDTSPKPFHDLIDEVFGK